MYTTFVPNVLRGQERMSDPLELVTYGSESWHGYRELNPGLP